MQNTTHHNAFSDLQEASDTVHIKQELEKYWWHWRWFFAAVFIALLGAFFFLRYSTPHYSATTSILIKDNQKSGISKELEAFKDMGIVGGGSVNNPDNEMEIIKSRKIIGAVVDSLNLTTVYYEEGRFKSAERYEDTPIAVRFEAQDSEEIGKIAGTAFTVTLLSERTFSLEDALGSAATTHAFGDRISAKIGTFTVYRPMDFDAQQVGRSIAVYFLKKTKVIDQYRSGLRIAAADQNSSVLKLSFTHPIRRKAEDFLDAVVAQYNRDAVRDKNEVSQKTKTFINARLFTIGKDLNAIQDQATKFKTDNEITGLSSEGELALTAASVNNKKLIQIQTELSIARGVLDNIKKQANKDETLPQNLGFSEGAITTAIRSYNALVLNKNRLRVNAGSKNPQILQLQNEIKALKSNLKSSISNLIASLRVQYGQMNREANKVNAKLSAIPYLERGFIDIARQQEIISGLYSYLLKKKEETAISLAVVVPNAKIIDVAYSSGVPVSPKAKIVYLAALLLGLLVPFLCIYLKNLLDTRVHTRKDMEDLTSIPFLGDIPHAAEEEKIVLHASARTAAAEAFRLLRTNLNFMLPKAGQQTTGQVIFVTSTTSGEGKSFISINTAAALALSGKKTLLLGMDLRAPKVAAYLGSKKTTGVTHYIMNPKLVLADLIFTVPALKNLDIITSGVVPPNPSELLLTDRVSDLFAAVKESYDYIVVDTAPVNLVTDTLLIAKHADLFIYVARANYIDKRMLAVPQALYTEKKLPNMALVLNDTDQSRGYGYGYGYSYAYGYGYGEEAGRKKPWYRKK